MANTVFHRILQDLLKTSLNSAYYLKTKPSPFLALRISSLLSVMVVIRPVCHCSVIRVQQCD